MNKQTIKVAVISVLCTLLVVGGVAAIALPKVIDGAKNAAVVNYSDEYEELAYILDESKDPIVQPNYIITGLIMSPDFQEYLDQGVQKGWWTEEFLEQFLIDEALPIFFTNYHALFSVILGSEPVQGAGEKITIIKAKVQEILYAIKGQVGKLSNLLNSPAIGNIKDLVATLEANKDSIANVIQTLQGIDADKLANAVANLQVALGNLQDVIDAINNTDFDNIQASLEEVVSSLQQAIETIKGLDMDSIQASIDQLKDIIEQIQALDKDQLAEDIAKVKAIIETIQNTDFSAIIDTINNFIDLINKIQNGEFDGVLGDLLESILNSDTIQDILDNIELTVDKLVKLLNIYFTKFIDYDDDYNFFIPIEIGDKTVDLSGYARLLNVIELDIPESGYVYDDNGTKANLKDDTLTINTINVRFEIDTDKTPVNILSSSVTISGSNAFAVKTAIPKINGLI